MADGFVNSVPMLALRVVGMHCNRPCTGSKIMVRLIV